MPAPNVAYEPLRQQDGDDDGDDDEAAARAFPQCPRQDVAWPEHQASFCERVVFQWFNPMIKLGNRTHIQTDDLWSVSGEASSTVNVARFEPLWRRECAAAAAASRSPDILRPLVRFALPMMLRVAGLQLLSTLFQFLRPLLLQQILLLCEGDESALPPEAGGLLALGMLLTTVADFLSVQHMAWFQYKQQVCVRAALIGMLYKQVVCLSDGTKAAYSSGKIVNMMDSDQTQLQTFTVMLNRLWVVPLTFFLAVGMIVSLLGWAGAIGVFCMTLLVPATRYAIMMLRTWKKKRVVQQDQRLKTLTEVMQGIRIIKFMVRKAIPISSCS
jgi:ABC-type bacteriocin/lantibiotic exporter with double-glycine peptidase domain|eukprot:COSAG01_NODE_2704_length_7224_cov_114.816281_3_plen_328_part_00